MSKLHSNDVGVWAEVNAISAMSIQFSNNTAASTAQIYGNGLNQVGVMLAIKAIDEGNNPVILNADDVWQNMIACDYESGAAINRISFGSCNQDAWVYTNQANLYSNPESYGSAVEELTDFGVMDSNVSYCTFYIFWDPAGQNPSFSKDVAASVKLVNGVVYSTARDATQQFNGHVNVTTLNPIRYTANDIASNISNMPDEGDSYVNFYIDPNMHGKNFIAYCENIDPVSSEMSCQQNLFPRMDPSATFDTIVPGVYLFLDVEAGVNPPFNTAVLWQYNTVAQEAWVPFYSVTQNNWFFSCKQAQVNVQRNALCITLVASQSEGATFNSQTADQPCFGNITIYDQFGNSGDFYFANDHGAVDIRAGRNK